MPSINRQVVLPKFNTKMRKERQLSFSSSHHSSLASFQNFDVEAKKHKNGHNFKGAIKAIWGPYCDDPWGGDDKILHITYSAYIEVLAGAVIQGVTGSKHAYEWAIIPTFAVGCYKEYIWDGMPSYKDLTADIIGIGVGWAILKLGEKYWAGIPGKKQGKRIKIEPSLGGICMKF